MKPLVQYNIIVKPSTIHGFGVFATKDIPANTLIEECYCLYSKQFDLAFNNFFFTNGKEYIMPTGFGCIYNHALKNNAIYNFDDKEKLMRITSNRWIHKGEEIFISYGKDWFDDRKIFLKKSSFGRKILYYLNGMPKRALLIIGGILIFIHLANALTSPQKIQKIRQILLMTIQQETDS